MSFVLDGQYPSIMQGSRRERLLKEVVLATDYSLIVSDGM